MSRQRILTFKVSVLIGLAVAAGASSWAQSAAVLEKEPPKVPGVLQVHYIRTGLFYLTGGGGNSVLRLSGEGLVLVDGKRAENYDELRLRVRKISNQVIRVVVNTDQFEDHTGTNAKFIEDHTPVLGQTNEKQILVSYHPSSERIAPPSDTYDTTQTLHLGPVQVELFHFGNGRTSADTVVYFPDKKVVALGDLYAATPDPDYAAGGSLIGWDSALGEVLKLDFDVAVPGNGPAVRRAEVESFKTKIDRLVARAAELVKSGASKDQLMTRLKTDDLGWKLSLTPEQVAGFYAELAAGPGSVSGKSTPTASQANPATK